MEEILGLITDFFQVNDFFKTFYEIIFTNKRILIVKSGETFRAFFASSDVAYAKREQLKKMNLQNILRDFEVVESIDYDEVENVQLKKRNFAKNATLRISLKNEKKVFYSSKEGSLDEYNEIFEKIVPSFKYSIA